MSSIEHDMKLVDQMDERLQAAQEESEGPVYVCHKCNTVFPRTEEHWHKNSHAADGFHTVCKLCRNAEKRIKAERRDAHEAQERLDAEMQAGLTGQIKEVNSGVVPSSEVYESIMRKFGGAEGFAMQYVATFIASKPGSSQREKMLRNLMQMGLKLELAGVAEEDARKMTDDELHGALQKALTLYKGDDEDAA